MQRRPISTALRRVRYGATQTARIAWYTGHYVVGRGLMGPMGLKQPRMSASERTHLGRRFRDLFAAELRSVESGEYAPPAGFQRPPDLAEALSTSWDYFRDAREIARRRARRGHSEVMTPAMREKYPRYYLQNFHYQSDGWLSPESASRYEMQVETLFTGAADVMRRRALPSLGRAIAGRDPSQLCLIDLGCGTGGFLAEVKHNWPGLEVTALDLSPAYLGKARSRLGHFRAVNFREGQVERTGYPDAAFDLATSVFLFHELPPHVRVETAREIARILKPGGVYIHVDTLQYGDDSALDGLLAAFPEAVHEPYYDSYCRTDVAALMRDAGLVWLERDELAFLSKVSAFRKQSAEREGQASAASAR